LQTAADGEENYLPAEEVQKLLEVASRFRGDVINETSFTNISPRIAATVRRRATNCER
jgi:hypothetical protein